MFEWSIVILCFISLLIGFSGGLFYANITYIKYKKTVDAITRHKGDDW